MLFSSWITFFGEQIFGGKIIEKIKNRRGLQRLVVNYGLESRYTIDDFDQCNYQYALYESGFELGFSVKN